MCAQKQIDLSNSRYIHKSLIMKFTRTVLITGGTNGLGYECAMASKSILIL